VLWLGSVVCGVVALLAMVVGLMAMVDPMVEVRFGGWCFVNGGDCADFGGGDDCAGFGCGRAVILLAVVVLAVVVTWM
jgi:hypothetical protein